jgi:hypothetical protein
MFRRRKSRPILSVYVGMRKDEVIEGLKEYATKERTSLERLAKEDDAFLKAEVMRQLFFKHWLLDGWPPSSDPEDYKDSILELYVVEGKKEKVVFRIPSKS